ncbi:hypothetical protein DFJ74DRAFT_665955 [Hyaloraphidium curvatum]|nr:hypothetical protein DFJ74DRAFT_665955 [Hyaloraphidium curvatum]
MASSRSKKEEIIAEVKREIAVQNFSLLVEKIQKNCFRLCVPTPGAKLDSSETTCTQVDAILFPYVFHGLIQSLSAVLTRMSRPGTWFR